MATVEISLTSAFVKPLKYYINSVYRKKVLPERGSIIYSDFGVSGIYAGDNKIININVEKSLDKTSEVKCISVEEFIRDCKFPESIYVSSDAEGAVKDGEVVRAAEKCVGEKNKFGLIYEDSHSFVKKCLDFSKGNYFDKYEDLTEGSYSPIGLLKQKAKNKMRASKWLLWDMKKKKEKADEIYTDENERFKDLNIAKAVKGYEDVPLSNDVIFHLKGEYREALDFFREINSEGIPDFIMKLIIRILQVLEEIIEEYDQNENYIRGTGGDFTFRQLKEMGDEFGQLVKEMERNRNIRDVIEKLGKGMASVKKEEKNKIAEVRKDEVFGINKSGDLARLLPCELLNLEDEDMEYLFYGKYLENNLLTYEIKGNDENEKKVTEEMIDNKGPIVVCLDTSGSMKGSPLLKGKALIMAIINILKKENRKLYIILFGGKGQLQEISVQGEEDIYKAVKFLKKGYEGGTDFETPLRRAVEIIDSKKIYNKADILMVTDGACKITYKFRKVLKEEKERLDFKICTVICEADRVEKDFSDRVVVI